MTIALSDEAAAQIRSALIGALEERGVLPDDPDPEPGMDQDIAQLRIALGVLERAAKAT